MARAARISRLRRDKTAVLDVELRVRVRLRPGRLSAGSEMAPPRTGLDIRAVLPEAIR